MARGQVIWHVGNLLPQTRHRFSVREYYRMAETVEVYREPHFSGYGSRTVFRAGQKVSPQAFPDVAELLRH